VTETISRAAFFLETPRGRRFCISSAPANSAPRGAVLYVPPFAEELNKTRRMAALAARAMAARGWLVLQPDPGGCGDSGGDFGDATWHGWREDLDAARAWLAARAPEGRRVLWALRAGCLLASDWLRSTDAHPDLLLWQPVYDGERHLNQFLRLEVARQMLANAESDKALADLRARLDGGKALEIAGYLLKPELAHGLAASRFEALAGYPARIDLIEVVKADVPDPAPSPATTARQESLAATGVCARAHAVPGPAFWQTLEVTEAPALIEKTLALLDECDGGDGAEEGATA